MHFCLLEALPRSAQSLLRALCSGFEATTQSAQSLLPVLCSGFFSHCTKATAPGGRSFIFNLNFCFVFLGHPHCHQGLLLILCSWISPDSAQETLWGCWGSNPGQPPTGEASQPLHPLSRDAVSGSPKGTLHTCFFKILCHWPRLRQGMVGRSHHRKLRGGRPSTMSGGSRSTTCISTVRVQT